jgi:hypothetical protein
MFYFEFSSKPEHERFQARDEVGCRCPSNTQCRFTFIWQAKTMGSDTCYHLSYKLGLGIAYWILMAAVCLKLADYSFWLLNFPSLGK